jgi:fucose 4-O-acetylase-like acetyltransferase
MTKKLLYFNGLAILAVILFHSVGWGFTAMFSWFHRYLPVGVDPAIQIGTIGYYSFRFIEQLVSFCIAGFLFVSGFFVAFTTPAKENTISWKTVLNRVKFLVIPYLIWTTLFVVLNFAEGNQLPLRVLARFYLTGASTPAYYFVILLVQLYLLAPFLVPLARNHWKILLVVTGLMQIAFHLLQYPLIIGSTSPIIVNISALLPKWLFLVRLFWFCLGMFIGFHRDLIKKWVENKTLLWGSLTMLFFVAGMVEWELLFRASGLPWIETRETLIDALYALTFLLTFLSFNGVLPLKSFTEKIGSQSFGIYLVHIPVMELVSRSIYHFAPWLLGQAVLFAFIIALTGLIIPLTLMWLVRKSPLQKTYKVIFG